MKLSPFFEKKLIFIILIFIIVVATEYKLFSVVETLYATSLQNNKQNMLTFPKGSNYEKEWQKVDSLTKKGLNKSALKTVKAIYAKAKAENNAPQFVKAIIHKVKFMAVIEEDAIIKSVIELQQEIESASFPIKPVLHSLLAEIYWNYYQQNRYKFLNRSEILNFSQEDIHTWDLKKIVKEVIKNYESSLENTEKLKKTPLNIYDAIITSYNVKDKRENSRKFRPTLYDFLAHRAVDFYSSGEPSLTKPAYKFEMNSKDYFQPAGQFVNLSITTKDPLSLKFYAINILRDLLEFHLEDKDPAALIDVNLKRLKFVYDHTIIENKDSLYLQVLEKFENKHLKHPTSADISYQIANQYLLKGGKYNPRQSEEHKWNKKKALQVCNHAIKRFPEADGAKNCEYLIARINEKTLSFTIEHINLPDIPFRALVAYKNVDKLYLRVIKTDREEINSLRQGYRYQENQINHYSKKRPIHQWSVNLPDDKDFQQHFVEIKIPALEIGQYVILAGTDENLSYHKNAVAYTFTIISTISYIFRPVPSGNDGTHYSGYDLFVMHRELGTPLTDVKIRVWYQKYNYKLRKYETTKGSTFTTNNQGYCRISADNKNYNFYLEFIRDKGKYSDDSLQDRFFSDNSFYYNWNRYKEKKKHLKTIFFTDRSIYRPGQTIYFKGIMIEIEGEKNIIKTNQSTSVSLYDVNYQKIATLNLVTNDYGTFSGSFTAPSGVLTGQMHIKNDLGSVYFSVEEYKRPKFEVTFNPVKGSYKLGENILVTGIARAYAGSNIDNSEVKYRVIRNARFPPWCYYWFRYIPSSSEMEITNGVTKTNEKGEFEINFKAIPDLSISKKLYPTFTYTVYADVTDITGETRSAQQYVNVGYIALSIDVNIPQELNKEQEQEFKITTTNLSGEFEPALGTISIFRLKDPIRIFRERLWEKPDKFIMSKPEFYFNFPNDVYDDENNVNKWEREKNIFESKFDTDKDKLFKIDDLSSWKQGKYLMEIVSNDKYGEEVKQIKYFTLYSIKDKKPPYKTIDWFSVLNSNAEPGEKAQILIGSAEKDVHVLYEIEHKKNIISKKWLTLNGQQKLIEIPIEEKYRGNIAVHFTFIKNNRIYRHDQVITVPRTNKELDIEFETFRNKLYPGQKEEWRIKILSSDAIARSDGIANDKIAAEMVATLYDASLDAFKPHNWYFDIYKNYYSTLSWQSRGVFTTRNSTLYQTDWNLYPGLITKYYDRLNWFGFSFYWGRYYRNKRNGVQLLSMDATHSGSVDYEFAEAEIADDTKLIYLKTAEALVPAQDKLAGQKKDAATATAIATATSSIKARTNFNETAFFYPHLQTNEKGEIIIAFTIPEALTRWKMMGFAHTKDLKYGMIQNELITQKELMVMPNPPRFFREGDHITFTAKVSNVSEKDLSGTAQLMLFDALTMKPVDNELKNTNAIIKFKAKKGQSAGLSWDLTIPQGIQAITYRVVAKAGKFSDGEEMALPVLTNKMLVTESLPLPIRGKGSKSFTFSKLVNSGSSKTLRNHKLTLEFTSNPAWYAIQALPYLMEFPYECSEQVFSRYYANSIASHIANSNPKIKQVFDSWRSNALASTNDAIDNSLLSNLEKNQELKSILLEETPWVLNAQNETERKKRIALLFDLNKMSNELGIAFKKLKEAQVSNGGWPWFKGMPESRYITQHIVAGFGHLDHLGIANDATAPGNSIDNMLKSAVRYLDDRIKEDHEKLKRHADRSKDPDYMDKNHLGSIQIHYLYTRSYFWDKVEISSKNKEAFDYYKGQAKKYWLSNNKYLQGMIALALYRFGDKTVPTDIIRSLKENALHSEEMGMYWKNMDFGYYWYQAPIETQALLIEVFDEVANDKKAVEDLKVWLLKQKQTQDWKTTKATVEACYALLLRGGDWLDTEPSVKIKLGKKMIDPTKMDDVKIEAGTGYFKTSWTGSDIVPEMGNITVTKTKEGVSWGALYWQYFEQLDKITTFETPLKLKKQLFLEKTSDTGPVLTPITEKTKLKPGDKIKVRIELRVDRPMEYIHMKDMRASGFEPINVISHYKYQGGLGYYESTRDAATNFFINYLPKGTYIFEYPLRVTHKGDFSNGITTIQCMYAPEFASHSEGIRIRIE